MKIFKKLHLSVSCLIVIQLVCFSNSAIAQSYSQIKLDPKSVSWSKLTFKVKNFSAEVNTQVQLESLPTAEVEAALIKSSQGVPINVSRPESHKISVNRVVDSIFSAPVTSSTQVWFNPQDATALGRVRLRVGKKDFKKTYRFTDQGVFRHRREPKDRQEVSKQPEQWTDVRDTFYTHNLEKLGCPHVTERLVLIYIISAAELSDNMKPLSFCVFGRRQLFQIQLKSDGLHSLKVDYIEKKDQGEIRRQGKVEALKIDLEIQPLPSDLDEDEDFSFLGFKEDIAIFIDPASNLPIQLSGKLPKVGNSTVKLRQVQLR
jgi:hypothetical protein